MNKIFSVFFFLLLPVTAQAALPTLDLEQKIAERQGRFGAYYVRCGTPEEKAVVAGDLNQWREEVLRGYNGTAIEKQAMINSFQSGAQSVLSQGSCADWVKKAAAEWNDIVQLSRYGRVVSAGDFNQAIQ